MSILRHKAYDIEPTINQKSIQKRRTSLPVSRTKDWPRRDFGPEVFS